MKNADFSIPRPPREIMKAGEVETATTRSVLKNRDAKKHAVLTHYGVAPPCVGARPGEGIFAVLDGHFCEWHSLAARLGGKAGEGGSIPRRPTTRGRGARGLVHRLSAAPGAPD